MKRHFTKYKDAYILGVILVTISILYRFAVLKDKEALGLILSAGTIYFGLLKHRIENDRVFKELFDAFNDKYSDEFNNLLAKLRNDEKVELIQEEINLVINYFNLCAEEYLWYSRGRLPKLVWVSWRSGILENLAIEQVRTIYNSEMKTENGKKSYYGLEKELKSYLVKH